MQLPKSGQHSLLVMKEGVKDGHPKAILSTIGLYARKTFKWAIIGIASAEFGMHSCDMIASQTSAGQKYTENVKKAVEDEENLFGIKFNKVPEVVMGYVAARNAIMSEFENGIQYDRLPTAEKAPMKALCYLLSTAAAVSFNSFLGPRIFGGQIQELTVEDKICQYAAGHNFVQYSLLLLPKKYSIDTIIQNPPNTEEEIFKPEIYVERISK